MLLGRAKSCRWQVFVRRRPPKQGELRTDVSKATMFQGDRAAKDLILFVVRRYLGVLIRGWENLEAPGKGVRIGTFCGVQKVPQKHAEGCGPLDSGERFKSPLDT